MASQRDFLLGTRVHENDDHSMSTMPLAMIFEFRKTVTQHHSSVWLLNVLEVGAFETQGRFRKGASPSRRSFYFLQDAIATRCVNTGRFFIQNCWRVSVVLRWSEDVGGSPTNSFAVKAFWNSCLQLHRRPWPTQTNLSSVCTSVSCDVASR